MDWSISDLETVYKVTPFSVEKCTVTMMGKPASHPFYRVKCPDWVNILPITSDGHAVLIRQLRVGSGGIVLETPGGVVDDIEKKDPTLTAARELEEETGYTASKWLYLGSMNPNPALQTNRIHYFVALGCDLAPKRQRFPDTDEHIQIELVKANTLDRLVREGRIDHALSALCIMLAGKFVSTSEGGLAHA